jgi:2-dehydro-3-deoxyphosphogalactonate aldolase
MAAYVAAGADGFGLGSAIYKPGDDAEVVKGKAAAFVAAWRGGTFSPSTLGQETITQL